MTEKSKISKSVCWILLNKMASVPQSTVATSSDVVKDICCSSCLDDEKQESAEFYCEECKRFYCKKCNVRHGKLFKKHSTYGRQEIYKWPVSKELEYFLLKCEAHKDKNITMFCNDHNEMCCHDCAWKNHRQCAQFIADSAKTQQTDLKQLSIQLKIIMEKMKKFESNWQCSIELLQGSYDEQVQNVHETRRKINTTLDEIEKITLKEMNDTLTSRQSSLKTDIENCISLHDELKQLHEAILEIGDKSKEELSFIVSKKSLAKIQQLQTYLKEKSVYIINSLIFQPNIDIEQYLSKLSGLGRIEHSTLTAQLTTDQVFSIKEKSQYDVRIQSDLSECRITAICALSDDQILVADKPNKKVKLLDQQYHVVSYCDMSADPQDICQIASSVVAITVNPGDTYQVQFFTVSNGQLVKDRDLYLEHYCGGIAHHLGDLYVTSGTALYKYSLSGKLVSKLYEDTSGGVTVYRCALSCTGDMINITNRAKNKLLTLDRDGSVLYTFTDPELLRPKSVHMTPAGQVLVCGGSSNTILQVENDGSKKLATLATAKDKVRDPMSVCYNRHTASIIVGQGGDKLLVLQTLEKHDVHMAPKIEFSNNGDLRRLLGLLKIDATAECEAGLFPAFAHGCASLQGIVTRGRSILEELVLNETESHMVNSGCIQIYTTTTLMEEIKASNPEQLNPIKDFSLHEPNISVPALVVVEDDQHDKIEQWISNLNEDVPGICVLLVGKEQTTTYIAPSRDIFLSMATMSNIMVSADDLLERAIFAVFGKLVKRCVKKYGTPTELSDAVINTWQSIYTYARTAYQRSEVPEKERPDFEVVTYTYPEDIDNVIKSILKQKGIVGCSKNLGKLEVLIEETQDSNAITACVTQLLTNVNVQPIFIYGKFTPFISSGDKVYKTPRSGTLGGFAERFPTTSLVELHNREETAGASSSSSEPGQLVALISRHVAIAHKEGELIYLSVNDNNVGQIKNIQNELFVDILPIDIYKYFKNQCDTRFKTEGGKKQMYGKLLDQEKREHFIGAPVYIWGAATSPGLGILGEVAVETPTGLGIKVHDRKEGQSFSKPGDSGAMVCATDSRKQTLYAVAMVVGRFETLNPVNPTTYVAVLLNEAFHVLKECYDSEFRLCTDDGNTK